MGGTDYRREGVSGGRRELERGRTRGKVKPLYKRGENEGPETYTKKIPLQGHNGHV